MSNLVINRSPELIAAEINNIKNQTRKMVLYNSIEIGRRLVEAKQLVSYGEWGQWLEKTVDYSQSTAQNLMRIFEEYGSDQISLLGETKSQTFGNLSYSQAVALLGIPSEEREAFVNEKNVENMSTRELQQAIKERDQAKKDLEDVRAILKTKSEEAVKYLDEKFQVESEVKLANQTLKETQSTVKQLQEALQKEKEESKKESERLQQLIDNMKNQISEAQESGDNEEVGKLQELLEKTEAELNESKEKIKELENELSIPPEAVVAEKIPEDIERELAELRSKTQSGSITSKFKVQFDILVKSFVDILDTLEELKPDEGLYEKYRNAIHSLIDRMVERL